LGRRLGGLLGPRFGAFHGLFLPLAIVICVEGRAPVVFD
jgi:hypothetical protein